MFRRRQRDEGPRSTMPPLLPEQPDDGVSLLQPRSLRRLRRLLLRLGPVRFTLLMTLVGTILSFVVTLAIDLALQVPRPIFVYTMSLSLIIPPVIAPPVFWFIALLMFETEAACRAAERLAITDSLTQTFNRRHFFRLGAHLWERAERDAQAISVLLMDIDHFKAVNDQHGHAVGDQVLKEAARVWLDTLREHAVLARFGGEEFVVLLPGTDEAEAAREAERLRRALEALEVASGNTTAVRPTASVGVATARPRAKTSLDRLLASADEAMYFAKRNGRNRVALASALY